MEIFYINQKKPDSRIIEKAANIILQGGLIVYPTDTAYGIGVNAQNENSIRKLYRIKNRVLNKPTHVIVRDWEMISKYTITNKPSMVFYEKLMPGPLTLILKKRPDPSIPKILTSGLSTLGVRIPDYKITEMLSNYLNFPYTTPSANRSGEPAPYSIDNVKKVLDIHLVDMILDAGHLPKNKPSTIVDLSKTKIEVLREGDISKDQIINTLNVYKVRSKNL